MGARLMSIIRVWQAKARGRSYFKEYQPFNNELLPVEDIPYKALPDKMGYFIKEQSEIRGCPPDFILVSLLARMSALFAGKIKIALTRNTNWHVIPNLYWGMIGDPSTGKSNALNATNKSVLVFEDVARKKYKHEFREYKMEMDSLTRKLVGAQKGMDYECKKESPKLTIGEKRQQ
jgi:hypothetical protein